MTCADWQGLEMRHRSKDLMINELFLATDFPIKKKKSQQEKKTKNQQKTNPHLEFD